MEAARNRYRHTVVSQHTWSEFLIEKDVKMPSMHHEVTVDCGRLFSNLTNPQEDWLDFNAVRSPLFPHLAVLLRDGARLIRKHCLGTKAQKAIYGCAVCLERVGFVEACSKLDGFEMIYYL